MTKAVRTVEVTDEDADGRGRPRLWAYGMRWLQAMSGLRDYEVRAAVSHQRGPPELDPADPVEAVVWILERRGHQKLADAVRGALIETP